MTIYIEFSTSKPKIYTCMMHPKMSTQKTKHILVLMMLLTLLIILSKADRVRVINTLSNGKSLQVHCKSKNDDLGVQQLKATGSFFEFKFRRTIFTLFFCGFVFDNKLFWFDIYVYYRDSFRCTQNCWWQIKETGPCLLNHTTGHYNLCHHWNKD